MAAGSSNVQSVFLIDVSALKDPEAKWDEAISLYILRVLSFLKSQTSSLVQGKQQKKCNLKWGYKFFSTQGQKNWDVSRLVRFRDFKMRYFEEFERDFKQVLSEHRTKVKPESRGVYYPARCLAKTLTEAIHDFQWETPDFGSPVKTRKGMAEQNAKNRNLSFLFSLIPCDKKALRYFANKVVMDADIFIDSFMSPALRKEFCIQRGIQLFWVDIGRYRQAECPEEPDMKSLDIVQQSLKTLGGSLLLFEALITPPSLAAPAFSQVFSNNKSARSKAQQSRPDIGMVVSTFARSSLCHSLMPLKSSTTRTKSLLLCDKDPSIMNTNFLSKVSLHIMDKECETLQHVDLKLIPVLKDHESEPFWQLALAGTTPSSIMPCVDVVLKIKACMKRAHVRMLSSNIRDSFICEPQKHETSSYQTFLCLIEAIHRQQQSLILTMYAGDIALPYLAVLEAVSAMTAQLSLLSFAPTLELEKIMTFQQSAEEEKADTKTTHFSASLHEFVQKAVAAIGCHQPVKKDKKHSWGENCTTWFWPGLLDPWHQPGSFPHFQSFLDRHGTRLDEMENLSDVEKNTLQRLQDAYCKENKALPFPVLPQHSTPAAIVTITPQSVQSAGDHTHLSGDSTSGSEGRNSLNRQNSLLARGRLMVSKAKQTPSLKLDESDGCMPAFISTSQRQDVKGFNNMDLKTLHDLEEYVQDQYISTVSSGVGLETTVQTLVTVTLHFMSQGLSSSCPQEATVELLHQKLLKSSLDLRACYQSLTSQEDSKKKITEYKLQVLLRLELESICGSLDSSQTDQTTNEILNLLRALLFITDTSEVSHFLNTTIAANYASSVPQMLVSIYDELMQPLPPSLAGFGSPTTVSSLAQEALSVSSHLSNDLSYPHLDSTQSQSSQSRRSRSLRSHPSLSEFGTKRQIMIEAKPQQKTKVDCKEKGAHKASKNKGKGKKKGPCRNLFENVLGQKHEGKKQDSSVSLENTRRSSPRKKRLKTDSSPHSSRRRPLVVETPARQQHNRVVWLQQQRERQRTNKDAGNVQVVEESPVKEATQTSPVVFKPVRRVLRKAFYSAGHVNRSRSLVRAEELSACIAGRRHPLKGRGGARLSDALLGEKDIIMTPTRQAKSFLHAQLIKSPSSGQVTPPRPLCVKPDPTTPSQNTRSKHLEDSSIFLSDGGDVMVESKPSRAMSALDFSSPVKHQEASLLLKTPTRKRSKKVCITPERKPVERTGWTAGSPENVFQIVNLNSSRHDLRQSCSAFTSPSKANVAELHSRLGEAFGSDVSSPITRSKFSLLAGPATPSKSSTPRTESSLTKYSSERPEKECFHQLTSLSDRVSARLSRCQKTENGEVQQVVSASASGCRKKSRRERSPGVQSSILDFVSPTRRVRKDIPGIDLEDTQMHDENMQQGILSSSHGEGAVINESQTPSKFTRAKSWMAHESLGADAGTASSSCILSPVKTPIKSNHNKDFMSPTKTPTRSILKNSPLFHKNQTQNASQTQTPSKSPRVTFDTKSKKGQKEAQTPSPARKRLVNTPDLLDKWPRRKRRWESDSSKSSMSSSSSGNAESVDSPSSQCTTKETPTAVNLTTGSPVKDASYGASACSVPSTNNRLVFKIKKQGSSFVVAENISSPRNKHKIHNWGEGSSGNSSYQRQGSFSGSSVDAAEDSVSDFSPSSCDVFLPEASPLAGRSSRSREMRSPDFKSQSTARSERGLLQHQPSFGSSSQGFDVNVVDSSGIAPHSPVFSSPVPLRRHNHGSNVVTDKLCAGVKGAADAELRRKRKRSPSENARSTDNCGRHGEDSKEQGTEAEVSLRKLTPLRIKGTQSSMKFSPGVSTSSLVHLMNSPILFGRQEKEATPVDAPRSHTCERPKSRKVLQL